MLQDNKEWLLCACKLRLSSINVQSTVLSSLRILGEVYQYTCTKNDLHHYFFFRKKILYNFDEVYKTFHLFWFRRVHYLWTQGNLDQYKWAGAVEFSCRLGSLVSICSLAAWAQTKRFTTAALWTGRVAGGKQLMFWYSVEWLGTHSPLSLQPHRMQATVL